MAHDPVSIGVTLRPASPHGERDKPLHFNCHSHLRGVLAIAPPLRIAAIVTLNAAARQPPEVEWEAYADKCGWVGEPVPIRVV